MKITLTNAGKRFNHDWIFRRVNHEFISGHAYAITGPNGSGKSTLLQAIAGAISLNEGSITYTLGEKPVSADKVYTTLSLAAPYLELIEEMTLEEFLEFHARFKPLLPDISREEMIAALGLSGAIHKQIRYYSSGMKQRVKLLQAIFSNTPVLLLDEPCTNLDEDGISLYHGLIAAYTRGRLVIVSSNEKQEFSFCREQLDVNRYKQ